MIIEIAGSDIPIGAGWWWMAVPVALIALGVTLGLSGEDDGLKDFVIVFGGLGLIAVPLILWGVNLDQERNVEHTQKVQALEEQGFQYVDLNGLGYTASRDGDYFSGSLVELTENTYQVVEKVEVK